MRKQTIMLLLVVSLGINAQESRPWEQYLNEVMTAEDAESAAWEDTYEQLCELEQHPLDINQTTREELEELPFLSAQQVEAIVEYLDRYGPVQSLGELMMIKGLDYAQRRLLTYFIYIGEEKPERFPSLKHIAQYGKHELTATARIPFYERKGDKDGYLGYPYRHWLRYQFTYGDYVKFGLVGAQDAGEPFLANNNRLGYDYYSPYLQLRKLGRIESLVVGKYRVSLGMGLVVNNSFGLGKVAMLQNLGRSVYSLRAHSSRSDDYLQGAAATVDISQSLKATAFGSYRAMDATLNKDATARTIVKTDYHRTETEMSKKHNLHQTVAGGNLRYGDKGVHLGASLVYLRLDRKLRPDTSALYRQHYPRGQEFLNASLDYGVVRPRLALNGETAIDGKGHLATINSLSLRLGDGLSLMALQRFYSYRYTSLLAQSYSDGGQVKNESGIYLGLSWQPTLKLRLAAYTDYAYFAWAKYRISQSSCSWDNLLQCSFTHHEWVLTGRYRLRMKQQDNEDKTALRNLWEHRMRLAAEYSSPQGFTSRTQLDGGYAAQDGGEWGMMLSESLGYTHGRLRLNAGFGFFDTDSYDSRVYLYERGPLYTYSMAQFYGEGIRYWLMVRANIGKHLMLTAKIGVTDYFDRQTISSGYQQVDGSAMSDLDLQVRWKF